ncbi:MAG: response regulator [Actinomycetia bacterium]|nr:response regulator [Actinomycetes bacterium]MCP3913537.1 response regulator [Actinomycetes bacterium]MCP4086499.1 response regulator [Actinomycetes bacterium]
MKILVVDDSPVMRKLINRSIRQAGFKSATVVEAGDGAEAIQVAGAERPDVILADWNMPIMTGIEMLRNLRTQGNNVKVGFVTSESTPEVRAEASAAGASFFLSKPIDEVELERAIEGVVG